MKPKAGGLFINWLSNAERTPALSTVIAAALPLHTPHHSHQSPLIVSLTSMRNSPITWQLYPEMNVQYLHCSPGVERITIWVVGANNRLFQGEGGQKT